MPISDVLGAVKRVVDPAFAKIDARPLGDELPDVAEENVQARIRGLLLMAHANRTGDILLTTGNKSEIAVGYCTLYGDMNGGLAVISDVLKTQLYALAGWMNANAEASGFAGPPIPQSTIDKPPSAELAPNQRDDDSLPPYPVLDQIIERYVEQRQQPSRIAQETGIDGALVDRVVRMIDRNEYKRKQMATGLKVTHVAFGFGRRMPIAQRWVGG
jgi:NAD+ synthase (glutamine-hydrolysing)